MFNWFKKKPEAEIVSKHISAKELREQTADAVKELKAIRKKNHDELVNREIEQVMSIITSEAKVGKTCVEVSSYLCSETEFYLESMGYKITRKGNLYSSVISWGSND